MDHLSNISGANLAALANSIAIFINKNYSISDIAKFIAFFTSTADILSLLVLDKAESIIDDSPSNISPSNDNGVNCDKTSDIYS